MAHAQKFRPGLVFKSGKLLEFQWYSLTVMNPWPQPLAWHKTTRRPFRPVRPKRALLAMEPWDDTDPEEIPIFETLNAFMAPVPAEARQAIGGFAERQWHVMALLARCPGALDLVHSTPALAFALASNWVFAKRPVQQPLRAARSLLRKRQVEICDWLEFPARPSTVSALRKFRGPDISVKSLLYLRDALWDDEIAKVLSHCATITRQLLFAATHPIMRAHVSPRFLRDLDAQKPVPDARYPNLDLRDALGWFLTGGYRQFRGPRMLQSIRQLYAAFNAALERPAAASHPAEGDIFPAPPFAGSHDIIPLRTGRDFLREGMTMKHCIASLHRAAEEGTSAFYSVLAPERATLLLILDNGVWRVDQLAGAGNKPVSQATWAAVYRWLGSQIWEAEDAQAALTSVSR